MSPDRPDLVLFDLDGTLVDSLPDIAYCVDLMLAEMGLPAAGEAQVRLWVGNGAERLVKRALTGTMEGEPADPGQFEQAHRRFLELYAEFSDRHSRLYPGAREGLAYVNGLGCAVGCVTNKPGFFTDRLLKSLGIYDDFQIVVSGDTLPKKKPDPYPLLYCAKRYRAEPARSVMVGDSVNDIQAARAAGFRILCVSYGYNHGNDIGAEGPDAVISNLAELAAYF